MTQIHGFISRLGSVSTPVKTLAIICSGMRNGSPFCSDMPWGVTKGLKVGAILFALALGLCSQAMVPGWGGIHPGWPVGVYYAIMAVAGAVAGMLMAERHRIPGMVGGAIAGLGSLRLWAPYMEHAQFITTGDYLLAVIGCLPGVGAYFLLKILQDVVFPPHDRGAALSGESNV